MGRKAVAGETIYDDKGAMLGRVTRVEGTTIWYVPAWVQVSATHMGNVHDRDGNAFGDFS